MEKTAHVTFSRDLTQTLADLRDRWTPYRQTFDVLSQRRRDFAPHFMRGYKLWQRETGRGFVAFVQQLDPTIPATDYKNHRSMRAALYLKRVVDAPHTIAGASTRTSKTPIYMLAVMIRSALPLVRPHEQMLWESLARVGRWHQRDVAKLQALARRVKPIVLRPDVPRLVLEGRRQVSRFASERVSAAADQRQSASA